MEKIKISYLKFITEKNYNAKLAEKLRGFFANMYKEEDLFHNHDTKSNSIYRMPLIQYKCIDKQLQIMGINKGADLVANEFLKHKEIKLEDVIIKNFETQLTRKNEEMFVDDNLYKYKFESIWLPINQKNINDYKNGKLDLNKTLANHILSNFKGCGITATKKIMVNGDFKEKIIGMKNKSMIGFYGEFVTNVIMPDLISVGKRRAVGYGCVKSI